MTRRDLHPQTVAERVKKHREKARKRGGKLIQITLDKRRMSILNTVIKDNDINTFGAAINYLLDNYKSVIYLIDRYEK